MRSRWILNLALAAIVIGLALFVYFRPSTDKSAGTPLTALTAETVTHIEIARAGQRATAFEKTAAGWRMRAPLAARANQFNIDSVLRVVTANSEFREPAVAAELSKYGLDKPILQLRFNDEAMAVGAMHPIKREHYLLHRDTVHLVPSYVFTAALLDYTSFLDTQLLEDTRQLNLVAVRLPGLQLTRHDGTWRREPPDPKRDGEISQDRVNEFVAHWQNARALSVARLSKNAAVDRIQLVSDIDGKRETLTLDVLAYKPEFVLARRDEGLEYHFPEEIGKQLLNLTTE